MRKRITRTIILLTLLGAVSQQDFKPLVDLISFPLGISLFLLAPLAVLAVVASPFALGAGLWLLWHRLRHGRLPGWVHTLIPAALKRSGRPGASTRRRPYPRGGDAREEPTVELPAVAAPDGRPEDLAAAPAARLAGEMAGVHLG
jgi:hypothetical protein